MRVNVPAPRKIEALNLSDLSGGLNLYDLPYRVAANQSADLQNVIWSEGSLHSRRGQELLSSGESTGKGYCLYNDFLADADYSGKLYAHIGKALYTINKKTGVHTKIKVTTGKAGAGTPIDVPEIRGTFFRYKDFLYYKTRGAYLQIDSDGTACPVKGFDPVTLINARPDVKAAGDIYQPENRLSAKKTVWYNAMADRTEYILPVDKIDSVDKVVVDDKELTVTTDYTVDLAKGRVNFKKAPPVTNPPTNNTVKITYSKKNPDAQKAIDDCRYVITYGGDKQMCVIMGGSTKQENAYFWNGNTDKEMDPGYFPIDSYNLAGATDDPITGFGRQHSDLIVLTTRGVGKTEVQTEEVGKRTVLNLPYTPINDQLGCDLPWTIKTVENNIVFANSYSGVYYLTNTSPADENNLVEISHNVNGAPGRPGLLDAVKKVQHDDVCSVDDGSRYWVVAGGTAFLWAYHLGGSFSDTGKLSWFRLVNIPAISFARDKEELYHLNSEGKVSKFISEYSDYGAPIEQHYEFSVQDLGGYYYLKDVVQVILSIKSDTNSTINITYENDYGKYEEPTPVRAWHYKLVPRNLTFRSLAVVPYADVAIRKPGYRHTRHFSMRVYNDRNREDLSIMSCQIFYKTQGRDR